MSSFARINLTVWTCGAILLGIVAWRAHERLETLRREANSRVEQRATQLVALRAERERLQAAVARLDIEAALVEKAQQEASRPAATAVREEALRLLAQLSSRNVLRSDRSFVLRERTAQRARDIQLGKASPGPLITPQMFRSEIFALTPDGRLSDQFAGLFQLEAERFAALQKVVATIKQQADDVTFAAATLSSADPGKLVIDVRPSAQTNALREQLRTALVDALGAVQFEVYDTLQAHGFTTLWSSFGAEDRTITITAAPFGSGRYGLNTQFLDEQGQPHGASFRNGLGSAALRAQLGPLASLLPADF
jgi:hypothetical protein